MDIDEVRRQNILILEKEAGSPKAMHEAVGMTYVQYVNLRDGAKDARSGKRRGMRKETAWKFDDAGKRPRGWLDQEHGETDPGPLNDLEKGLILMYRKLPERLQDSLQQIANNFLSTVETKPSVANPFNGAKVKAET